MLMMMMRENECASPACWVGGGGYAYHACPPVPGERESCKEGKSVVVVGSFFLLLVDGGRKEAVLMNIFLDITSDSCIQQSAPSRHSMLDSPACCSLRMI